MNAHDDSTLSAAELIERLSLAPHPEGGHFRETWRDQPRLAEDRGHGTAIYYLLEAGERSHWHRVDATEIWHFYAGGPDLSVDQHPQLIVPAGAWQSARPLGAFTLAGCTVSPAFDFDGFELAPPGWDPAG
jgi:predicted cupin superfamily sugar epimerase